MIRLKRPSVVSFTTLWTAEVVGEFSAQLNLTEKTKKKVIPYLQEWPEALSCQKRDSGLSLEHS